MDLTGKAVIITGSSSGIGAAVARRLSGLGAGVVVNWTFLVSQAARQKEPRRTG
jgi:NAD(P)-dependent dehydrogenase (short-subunit alcohol dehydrogenase family)